MSNNNIEYENAIINDDSLTYFSFYTYNKLMSNLRYYNILGNEFDAQEIVQGIYLGSISASYNLQVLKNVGVTHIVSVIAGYDPPYPNDFKYLVINALDNKNNDLSNVFDKSNKFIDECLEENGKILIHCAAGRSRSASILIAYLMNTFAFDFEDCLYSLKHKRNIVEPNPQFTQQLKEYYKSRFEL